VDGEAEPQRSSIGSLTHALVTILIPVPMLTLTTSTPIPLSPIPIAPPRSYHIRHSAERSHIHKVLITHNGLRYHSL